MEEIKMNRCLEGRKRKGEWLDRGKEGCMEERMDGQMIIFKAFKSEASETDIGWSDCAPKVGG